VGLLSTGVSLREMTAGQALGVAIIGFVIVTLPGDRADRRAKPGDPRFDEPAYWQWGSASWFAFRKVSGVSAPAVLCLGLFMLLGQPLWLACVFFGWILVTATVVLFNQPRLLVVRGLRAHPGLVPHLLRRLRDRRQG
jgi:hypothetical protein